MNRNKQVLREGFWWSEQEPYLPKPVVQEMPWKGQKKFLKALASLEATLTPTRYKGFSKCRVCDRRNGTTEYHAGNWVWPDGLRHYIEAHNVRPSLAFQEFVLGKEIGK